MERYGCACQDHQTNLKCEGRSVSLKGNGLTFFQLEIQNSMTLASDLYNNSIHNIYIYLYIYTLLFGIFWYGPIFLNYSLQLLGVKVLQEC